MSTIEQVLAFWDDHGTKMLGSLSSVLGAAQTAVLAMNAIDPQHPVVSTKMMIVLAGVTTFFGTWTVKRGFVNSASLKDTGQQSGV